MANISTKNEMIQYTNRNNDLLNGILYYPMGYEKGVKYPLVVFIYESWPRYRHQFIAPSLYNGIGFNISNFVLQGYAVLLPDIVYEKGKTGKSALDCVSAAVKKIIALGVADEKKIGLVGQSFGGYETNYIITQTDLFATAVSGAAVFDVVQHYFTLNREHNTMDGWRYENQQYRIGSSFFENQSLYDENSPLKHANSINIPVLSWSGKLDINVSSQQAETFYAAMRRLKKEHVMLVYENEGHIFENPENQADLTLKTEAWLAHYLKDAPKELWMKPDIEQP